MRQGLHQEEVARRGWAYSTDEAKGLVGRRVALIDLREKAERDRAGTIPGSEHGPLRRSAGWAEQACVPRWRNCRDLRERVDPGSRPRSDQAGSLFRVGSGHAQEIDAASPKSQTRRHGCGTSTLAGSAAQASRGVSAFDAKSFSATLLPTLPALTPASWWKSTAQRIRPRRRLRATPPVPPPSQSKATQSCASRTTKCFAISTASWTRSTQDCSNCGHDASCRFEAGATPHPSRPHKRGRGANIGLRWVCITRLESGLAAEGFSESRLRRRGSSPARATHSRSRSAPDGARSHLLRPGKMHCHHNPPPFRMRR